MKLEEHNPFNHFKTPSEINEFLTHVYETEEPEVFTCCIADLVKNNGVAETAKIASVSQASLKRLIQNNDASYVLIQKIVKALNIQLQSTTKA